jgi:toxin ParE1/3/4
VTTVEVRFRPHAQADLFDLYRYIAKVAGHPVSGGYIERIEAACMELATFPERGTRRDDIRPGLRTIGFERRAIIAFQVRPDNVLVGRVLYGGRDLEHALRQQDKEE